MVASDSVAAARGTAFYARSPLAAERAALDAVPDPILILDAYGRIEFMNETACRTFGYAPAELAGQTLAALLAGESLGRRPHLAHLLARTRQHLRVTGRTRTGDMLLLELSAREIASADGRRFLALARRPAPEDRTDQSREAWEFEQLVLLATNELQEPLRMVASFTELFARRYRDQVDPTGQQFIAYVGDGARRMTALVNELQGYALLGSEDEPFAGLESRAVLEEVRRVLRLALADSDGVLTADALPRVFSNRQLLRQLLFHLLGNAIKFRAPARAVRVHVSAAREAADRAWRFAIRDNGRGIAQAHHRRIFSMFQRVNRDRQQDGNGIGLAICRRIVELHGGRIWVESAPDQGATFYFTLPDCQT